MQTVFTEAQGGCHIQGIAVDPKKGYIYYSFTTKLIKAKLDGTIVGSVDGLTGHLGCIDFNDADGKVYGSLEYKNDVIGRGINSIIGVRKTYEDSFYMTIFDVDKINRMDMDAEKDGVMTAVYLKEVVDDFNGTGINKAGEVVPHRYGCSGIDGTAIGPMPGDPDGKDYLFVCYGIYSDLAREDNDHQVILCYDLEELNCFAQPLSQEAMHKSGPAAPKEKLFVFTGNTTYGVQNLEYDPYTKGYFMALYPGKKPEYPNFKLMQIDATAAPVRKPLQGLKEEGMCLTLKKVGKELHPQSFGWFFELGATGLYAYGDGRYLICQPMLARNGQCGLIMPFTFDVSNGFVVDA